MNEIQKPHHSGLAGRSTNPSASVSMNSAVKERDLDGTGLDRTDTSGTSTREADSLSSNMERQKIQTSPKISGPESLKNREKRVDDTACASASESSVQAVQRTLVQSSPFLDMSGAGDMSGWTYSSMTRNQEARKSAERPANVNYRTAAGPSPQSRRDLSESNQIASLDGSCESMMSSMVLGHRVSSTSTNSNAQAAVRPLVTPRQQRVSTLSTIAGNERRSDIVLPKWQPDSEVDECPICRKFFSFFLRKHHCRKCGRVVCNSCSPHRITIPHQYIVQPPVGFEELELHRTRSRNVSQNSIHDSDVGGGMRVRLCNPCVPDPNTSPPEPTPPLDRPLPPLPMSASPPPQAPPRTSPRVRTSELCPVCGDRLPPSTTAIENHIDRCIARRLNQVDSNTPASRPHPSEDTPGSVSLPSSSRTTSQLIHPRHTSEAATLGNPHVPDRNAPGSSTGSEVAPSRPFLSSRMICFAATQIDTVGEDSECIICMEDFEEGMEMARLECLCKYHKKCIDGWFFKNPGRCPVHGQDNY